MATSPAGDITLSITGIATTAQNVTSGPEADIVSGASSLSTDASPSQLLAYQAKLTVYTTEIGMYSAIIKELGDALKGVTQKF